MKNPISGHPVFISIYLTILSLFLASSCTHKQFASPLKDTPPPNAPQKTRLPSSLCFVPDWNTDHIARPSDIAKITALPQNLQYYEPISKDLICYYYRRTHNPSTFFPNLPNNALNDNEYEVWTWSKKQKKVIDIRTGGIETIPAQQTN